MIKISKRLWDEVPDWVQYIAQDEDGEIWGYSQPVRVDKKQKQWVAVKSGDPQFGADLLSYDDAGENSWETSLESRDTHA